MPEKIEIKAEIKEEGKILKIQLFYPEIITKRDFEESRLFHQKRLSKEAGKQVPIEEITAEPKEGELSQAISNFVIEKDRPLYVGLKKVPTIFLTFLIKELENFKSEIPEVVSYAISELINLVKRVG